MLRFLAIIALMILLTLFIQSNDKLNKYTPFLVGLTIGVFILFVLKL